VEPFTIQNNAIQEKDETVFLTLSIPILFPSTLSKDFYWAIMKPEREGLRILVAQQTHKWYDKNHLSSCTKTT
jgi:hypothetical protein